MFDDEHRVAAIDEAVELFDQLISPSKWPASAKKWPEFVVNSEVTFGCWNKSAAMTDVMDCYVAK